jgi:UDP-N-acetylglucosamine acyltransferase
MAVIGPHVRLSARVRIGAHAVVDGRTTLGEDVRVGPNSVIGTEPQDLKYAGEPTELVVGARTNIREFANINRGTAATGATIVGSDCLVMAYAHIAHDCSLGDGIILSNVATLGGHISVGDHAILGGQVAVHQFVRIGAYAMVGGKSGVDRDVPPFMMTAGERAKLYGLNRKGLSRHGFSPEAIDGLKKAFKIIWRDHQIFSEGISRVREEIPTFPELEQLLAFLEGSKRGILR